MNPSIRIALIQAAPIHHDWTACLDKALHLMLQAAQGGAELIVFGETWLSGYPAWLDHCPNMGLWDHPPTKKAFASMYANSVDVPGPITERLGEATRQLGVYLVIGINERVSQGPGNGTLYNSLLIFNREGQLVNHHRKLMPTYTEKMLYGLGDGQGLKTVETEFGRLGGLICWEHWMPLTRQALHDCGEHIHIALWPNVHEMLQVASRSYAFEGRCFVVAVGQIMRAKDIPEGLGWPEKAKDNPDYLLLQGGSCVVAPNGRYLLEPQFGREDVFWVDIDNLTEVYEEKMTLDVTGHYQRMDVFQFGVSRNRKG